MDSFDAHENSDLEIKERWDVEREKTFKHSLINQRDGRRKKPGKNVTFLLYNNMQQQTLVDGRNKNN